MKPMRIDVSAPGGCSPAHVYVNGHFVSEVVCAVGTSRDDIMEEVGRARAAHVAASLMAQVLKEYDAVGKIADHNYPKPSDKRSAFSAGLLAGLTGDTQPHPMASKSDTDPHGLVGVPDIVREATPSYMRGFDLGEAIRRAVAAAGGENARPAAVDEDALDDW